MKKAWLKVVGLVILGLVVALPAFASDDIEIRVRQINTPSPTLGRVNIELVEPGRTACIVAGRCNLGAGQILILDADGDPSAISEADNDRRDNVGWDVRVISGRNEVERGGTFTLGAPDDKADYVGGRIPIEAIRVGGLTPGSAERTHFNVAHFRYTGNPSGEVYLLQWRVTSDGVRHESDWLGPIKLGRQ